MVTHKKESEKLTIPEPAISDEEFEQMMKEFAEVAEKHGFKNLGLQQTLSGTEGIIRLLKPPTIIDIITNFVADEEVLEQLAEDEEMRKQLKRK